MKKTKQPKRTPFENEIHLINFAYNKAKSHISFDKSSRTYGKMASLMGKEIVDRELAKKPIFLKDLEIYKNQLETIVRDKYASRKYLLENIIEPSKEDIPTLELELVEEDEVVHSKSTYKKKYPDQIADLLTKEAPQVKAARQLFDNITIHNKKAQLLLAQTGAGKTYILGSVIKNLLEQNFIENNQCISPWPIMYVTKASIVEQTKSVLRDEFNIDTKHKVMVINIEFLRTALGSIFVNEKTVVVEGEPEIKYVWKPLIHPLVVIWDECHILARPQATQTQIAQALNDVNQLYGSKVIQIFSSATPFAKVSETKCFSVATGKKFQFGAGEVTITNENFRSFSQLISSPYDPETYSTKAIGQYVDYMEDHIVRVRGIKPAYKAYNRVQRIGFETLEEEEEYEKAWEKYLKEKAKLESREGEIDANQLRMQILAQFTIFRKAAEKIRRHHLAKFAHQAWENGKAPVIAAAFKGTIVAVYRILVEEYGWSRQDVSLIWGGSTESLSKKKKITKKMKENEEFLNAAKEAGIDLGDLGFDIEGYEEKTEEQLLFEKSHHLLTQKPEDREREKLRFQRQDSKLVMFTFKAGGVGLSLHHESKYPKARPREVILTPVYSEKELVQALGRAPRITSQSDTSQTMCFYADTIETSVAERVVMKLKCVSKVNKGNKESWEDLITGRHVIEDEDDKDRHEEFMDQVDAAEQSMLGEYKED